MFYSPFLHAVSCHGYHVVGVHLLSHGRSPRVVRRFTLDDLVGNVTDAVGYACARFPGPVAAMGSSQGGVLTLLAAGAEHRIRVAFAHNILFPPLRQTLSVTSLPDSLAYPALRRLAAAAGPLLPGLPVPLGAYLDAGRIFSDPRWRDAFYRDPLGRTTYPLGFLSSLVASDMPALVDGSITCPVVVLAAAGDPLFPLGYSRLVHERLVAPEKRFVEVDADHHLILNERVEDVLPTVLAALDDHLRRPGVEPGDHLDDVHHGHRHAPHGEHRDEH